jgi:hypothetical protein
MATFVDTLSPTAFGLFDSDTEFQTEADSMVRFVKGKLGDDVVSVALTKRMIWTCLEEASQEYSRLVNEYQIQNNIATLLGQPTGSNVQQYNRETLSFLLRQAEPYAMEAGYQGYQDHVSGSIELVAGKQDYDLYSDLKDNTSGVALFDTQPSGSQTSMRIMEVFHFSALAAYRFFDSTSAINFLNNEFSFESFTPETIFYVLPVFEDLLRAGQMQVSQRVRRSNYYYKIRGHQIRIFPTPTGTNPKKLWVRVMFSPDPLNPSFNDDSLNGIANMNDIPYGLISYSNINSLGRTWIRQFTLALCMEVLGYVRGKYTSIPVPTGEVTLNYGDLLTNGRADKDRLVDTFREYLTTLTEDALLEKEAAKAENLMKQLRGLPMPNGYFIVPG